MLKIITIILAIIVAAVLLLQIDDKLNPEIEPFLSKGIATEDNDAYFYLMGIDAPANENPLAAGKKKYESIDPKQSIFDKDSASTILEPTAKLALPKNEYFQHSEENNWLNAMFEESDALAEVLSNNAVLLARYQSFIKMKDYRTLAKPTAPDVFPPYTYLEKGNQLLLLKAIHTVQTSGVTEAVPLVMNNISALRLQLQNADEFFSKGIYASLISDNLDLLSILSHQQTAHFETKIAPISSAERNLEIASSREYSIANGMLDQFINGRENQTAVANWFKKLLLKPNMTANQRYENFKKDLEFAQLEQLEFANSQSEAIKNYEERSNQISWRNFVGSVHFYDIFNPNVIERTTQLFDLNAKISVFNQLSDKTELPMNVDDIQNPYYDTNGTAYYSKNGKSICVTGWGHDNHAYDKQWCLRVEL